MYSRSRGRDETRRDERISGKVSCQSRESRTEQNRKTRKTRTERPEQSREGRTEQYNKHATRHTDWLTTVFNKLLITSSSPMPAGFGLPVFGWRSVISVHRDREGMRWAWPGLWLELTIGHCMEQRDWEMALWKPWSIWTQFNILPYKTCDAFRWLFIFSCLRKKMCKWKYNICCNCWGKIVKTKSKRFTDKGVDMYRTKRAH